MTSLLWIKLTLTLACVPNAYCQYENSCEEDLMRVGRENFIWNDQDNRILSYNSTHYNVFRYTLSRTWAPEVSFESAIKNSFQQKLFYGFTLYGNTMLEALKDKISIIVTDDLTRYTFTRYSIPVDVCRLEPKADKNGYDSSKRDHNISSLLFALCETSDWADSDMYVLSRNPRKLKILRISTNSGHKFITIQADESDSKFLAHEWKIYQKSAGKEIEKSLPAVYIDHAYSELKLDEIAEPVKKFFKDVLYFIYHLKDSENYLLAIKSDVTLVYNADQKLFKTLVRILDGEEDVSSFVSPVSIAKFPNNYWHDCYIQLCDYSDMDIILNLDLDDGKSNWKIIKNGYYFYREETDAPPGVLTNLTFKKTGKLRNLLSSLIQNVNSLDKDTLSEFLSLRNLNAGDHLILDDKRDMFFFVKENYVYFLINTRTGRSVSQLLVKQDIQSFFSKKVSNSLAQGDTYIQSIFTRPGKRLVVLMKNFLIQYSYANWDKANLAELEEDFKIITLSQISTSISHRNSTYAFGKHYFQVFSGDKYNDQPVKQISGNFLFCYNAPVIIDKQPDLFVYSINRPARSVDLLTSTSVSSKIIIQIVGLISVLTVALFFVSLIYIKKFQQKSVYMPKKEFQEKRSISGSSANLSTIFNLAKSSSDKPTKDQGNSRTGESKLILPEPEPMESKDASKKDKSVKSSQSKYTLVTPSLTFDDLGDKKKSFVRAHSKIRNPSNLSRTGSKIIAKTPSKMGNKSGPKSKIQAISSKVAPSASPSKLAVTLSKASSKMQTITSKASKSKLIKSNVSK